MNTSPKSHTPLNVVSLHTGAGGLDLGFEAAGFTTRVAVEVDRDARETLEKNRPDWLQPERGDALKLEAGELLRLGGLGPRQVDALIGGPHASRPRPVTAGRPKEEI